MTAQENILLRIALALRTRQVSVRLILEATLSWEVLRRSLWYLVSASQGYPRGASTTLALRSPMACLSRPPEDDTTYASPPHGPHPPYGMFMSTSLTAVLRDIAYQVSRFIDFLDNDGHVVLYQPFFRHGNKEDLLDR